MTCSSALEYKKLGNEFYKKLDFKSAIENYSKAIHDSESEKDHLVYISNRSAAYFESGDYKSCSKDCIEGLKVFRSLSETDDKDHQLYLKLANRLLISGQCLNRCDECKNAVETGLIDGKDLPQTFFNQFAIINDAVMPDDLKSITKNLGRSPIRSFPPCEYYPVGHDVASSALSDFPENFNDIEKIDLFYAGIGDGRHFFITLLDAYEKKRENLDILLNDLNANVLARLCLIFIDLEKLTQFSRFDRGNPEFEYRLTAISQRYMSATLMPEIYDETLEMLELLGCETSDLAVLIPFASFLNENTIQEVKRIFRLWKSRIGQVSLKDVIENFKPKIDTNVFEDLGNSVSDSGNKVFDGMNAAKAEMVDRILESISEETLGKHPDIPQDLPWKTRKDMYRKKVEEMAGFLLDMQSVLPMALFDHLLVTKTKILMPPSAYPGMESITCEKTGKSLQDLLTQGREDFENSHKYLRDIVKLLYKNFEICPNPCVLDFDCIDNVFGGLSSSLSFDGTYSIGLFYDNIPYEPPKERSSSGNDVYEYYGNLFWKAAQALKGNNIKVTFSVGDIIRVSQSLESQERKFHRIYASNIPDYCGLLITQLSLYPILYDDCHFVSNVLFNTGIWEDYDQYVFSSTLLRSADEVTRFLGLKLNEENNNLWGPNNPCWTRVSKEEQAAKGNLTRGQVQAWLERLFLGICFPATRDCSLPCFEVSPMSLNVFILVIDRLAALIPIHWLVSIVTDLLVSKEASSKTAFTEPAPRSSPNKLLSSSSGKIYQYNIQAFHQELSCLFSIWVQKNGIKVIPRWDLPMDVQRYAVKGLLGMAPFHGMFGNLFLSSLGILICPGNVIDACEKEMRMSQPFLKVGRKQNLLQIVQNHPSHAFSVVERPDNDTFVFICSKRFMENLLAFTNEKPNWKICAMRTDCWLVLGKAKSISDIYLQ